MRTTPLPQNWMNVIGGDWESWEDGKGDGGSQAFRYAIGNLAGDNYLLSSVVEVHDVQAFYEDTRYRSL